MHHRWGPNLPAAAADDVLIPDADPEGEHVEIIQVKEESEGEEPDEEKRKDNMEAQFDHEVNIRLNASAVADIFISDEVPVPCAEGDVVDDVVLEDDEEVMTMIQDSLAAAFQGAMSAAASTTGAEPEEEPIDRSIMISAGDASTGVPSTATLAAHPEASMTAAPSKATSAAANWIGPPDSS